MTEINTLQQKQIHRLIELGNLAKKRHLDSGGNPHIAVGSLNQNDTLTDEERTEYLAIAKQVFNEEAIANYLQKEGTWQERFTRFKSEIKEQ